MNNIKVISGCGILLLVIALAVISLATESNGMGNQDSKCAEIVKSAIRNISTSNYLAAEIEANQILELGIDCKIKGLGLLTEISFLQGKTSQYHSYLRELAQLSPERANDIEQIIQNTPETYLSAAISLYEGYLYSGSEYKKKFIKVELLLLQYHRRQDIQLIKRAESLLKEVLSLDPKNYAAHMLIGRCYLLEYYKLDSEKRLENCNDKDAESLQQIATNHLVKALNIEKTNELQYVRMMALMQLELMGKLAFLNEQGSLVEQIARIILEYQPENENARNWLNSELLKTPEYRGIISGILKDSSGRAIGNITVDISSVTSFDYAEGEFIEGYYADTNNDGQFTVKKLPPGKYIIQPLQAEVGNYSIFNPRPIKEVILGDGETISVDFGAIVSGILNGRVNIEEGNIPAGSKIYLKPKEEIRSRITRREAEALVTVNEDGSFEFRNAYPGENEVILEIGTKKHKIGEVEIIPQKAITKKFSFTLSEI